ncbi:MAG: sensor histidine kinase, partial [Planctomycetota bacterium]
LRGTDLWYRARLELFRLEGTAPDADWIDDVSALIGGPSDGIGQTLLKQAGVEPVRSRRERAQLAALEPSVGLGLHAASFQEVRHGEANELVLKRIPIREFGWVLPRGSGPVKWRDESRLNFTSTFDRRTGLISEPLPAPLGELSITAELDEEKLAGEVRRETWLVVLLYACAGLLVALATGVSLVATRRALRLARDQSDFVANVTHELKTPLANVHLYAESLRQGRVREEDREAFLDTILEETRRLDGLVEGLLHAARGAKITRARVDTRELVKQAAARWRPRLEEEGFEFEVAPGPSVEISADAEALLRALDNLLDNARKYSREDRRIHLSGSCNDGLARLTVRDHGPGIPVQDRKRVLEPFTRLESADRKATPGTGLGLSLAAACMKAHGGRVEISENSGAGSVVSLVLVLEGVR